MLVLWLYSTVCFGFVVVGFVVVVVISLLVICRVGCLLYVGLMVLGVSVLNSVGRGLAGLLRLAGLGLFWFCVWFGD